MKALVVYDSAYGNTAKVAAAIAAGMNTRALQINDVSKSELSDTDLLVIGSPTQGGQPLPSVMEFVDDLSSSEIKGKKFAAFDTRFDIKDQNLPFRILMKTIGYAAEKIAAGLRSKDSHQIAKPEGFVVIDKEGPLKPGELERASIWGKQLLAST